MTGVVELRDLKSFGRLGSKTFGLYFANTIIAIVASIALALWIEPGAGMQLVGDKHASLTSTELPGFIDMIVNIIPSNPVHAFATGNMLQIIFMALLTGGVVKAIGEEVEPVVAFSNWVTRSCLK